MLLLLIILYTCVIIVGLSKDCIVLEKVFSKPIDLQLMFVSSVWNLESVFVLSVFLVYSGVANVSLLCTQ